MAFVPFVETDQPTMAAFNEKFQQCITDAVDQGLKTETVTYSGTGTYGSGNARTLTFSFTPKIVLIYGQGYSGSGTAKGTSLLIYGITGADNSPIFSLIVTSWNENRLTFYGTGSAYYAANMSGSTYTVVAIA